LRDNNRYDTREDNKTLNELVMYGKVVTDRERVEPRIEYCWYG